MKTIKRIFVFVALTAALLCQPVALAAAESNAGQKTEKAVTGPQIKFDTKKYDFGNIHEDGGGVSCEFKFTNTGDAPLVIISATASCGCTRPKFPAEPIKPGESATIKVTYLPKGRPGVFDKTVKVRTNAKKKSEQKLTLRIIGNVIPAKSKKK